ncbi:GNAT family N-acetyltransferase [Aeromonas bestiarum]|jgi:ribosomal protein S18 acetylase RimI-like enzyme|uniref:GNAT family N-acetyltransferase n=1 Tax=Aeromonas bestiarum TaxID=105751 RepID=A0ABT7PZ98_9GAMM|nr:GNAT family N-acetyltransferase [Aeromonas bestiarum]MDM5072193.1 GNAT family N-acetyltransferase [Aeromonas bestiarum]WDL80791.1 GNAT family N-acetyltransferase [Aeromonas bestiarum]
MIHSVHLQLSTNQVVVLRKQNDHDRTFLCELYLSRRWVEVRAVPGWNDAQRRAFLYSQAELQRQHYENHFPAADFLIVEQAGSPIGRLCVNREAHDMRIVDIALLPAWQGRGIGTQLLRTLLAEADADRQSCSLSVEQGSPARRLYERLGFQPCADSGLYTQMQRPAKPAVKQNLDNP